MLDAGDLLHLSRERRPQFALDSFPGAQSTPPRDATEHRSCGTQEPSEAAPREWTRENVPPCTITPLSASRVAPTPRC